METDWEYANRTITSTIRLREMWAEANVNKDYELAFRLYIRLREMTERMLQL